MDMEIVVLVCASALSMASCDRASATAVLHVPEEANSATGCFMQGMFYAAQSNTVVKGTYPKIICEPREDVPHALRD
jgi:Na+/H+ antiporter NhaC